MTSRASPPLRVLPAVVLVLALAACGGSQGYASMDALVADVFGPEYDVRSGGDFGLERMAVHDVDDGPVDVALTVSFPQGSASPEVSRETGAPGGGAQVYLRFADGPTEAARLSYWVRFPEGFDFVKGGKLPGLYGGTATSGGNTPDGTDGFSTRYMWRANGEGEVYAYLPASEETGTSLGRGAWSWPIGRWVEVEQEVRLNTPGQEDGVVVVRLDGEEVLREGDLVFRESDDVRIDGVFFSTFFGGGDPSWATPVDQTVEFGGFEVQQDL